MTQTIVLGLNPSGKVPGAKWNVQFGKGKVSVGAIPRYLLIMGNKVGTAVTVSSTEVSNAGTASTNVIYEITPDVDVDSLFGSRSELARMIAIARRSAGVRIKAVAVPEATAGTPAKSTATITIATNASSSGTWRYHFGGKLVEVAVASGDTPTTQATAIRNAFNAISDLPGTATSSSGVATISFAHVGTRGDQATLYQDTSLKPGGSTSTLASNNAYSVATGPGGVTGVRLGDGASTDDVTNTLDVLDGQTFFTIAVAQIDSTNLGLVKTYNDDKATLGSQRYEHICFGQNGLKTTAVALTDAINKERWSCAWQQGGENLPGELAASLAALRTQAEQLHPNPRYMGSVLLGISPQRALTDRPSEGETGVQQAALDDGITPVTTTDAGEAIAVRVITTKHLKTIGATTIDFYGTLDVGDARSIDVFAEELQLAWLTEYGANNPYVDDDPAPGEPNRPTGVATPRTWNGYVKNIAGEKIADNWFSEVSVDSEYDSSGKQILTTIQATPTPKNYRIAGNIAQTF